MKAHTLLSTAFIIDLNIYVAIKILFVNKYILFNKVNTLSINKN